MHVYNLVLERCAIWKPLVPADPYMDLGLGVTGQCLVYVFLAEQINSIPC